MSLSQGLTNSSPTVRATLWTGGVNRLENDLRGTETHIVLRGAHGGGVRRLYVCVVREDVETTTNMDLNERKTMKERPLEVSRKFKVQYTVESH